jgi:glycosyltransferase involved in cell wall biosynthesis
VPYFSTIIPAYNRADLIRQTLDSVFAQDFSDQEIIVVDDGSTDGTLDVLKRYGDRIRVLTQTNHGPGAARNLGISVATGKYFTMFDSDDVWFPWTLGTYKKVIEENAEPVFIAGCPFNFQEPAELAKVSPTPLRVEVFDNYLDSLSPKHWTPRAAWRWYGNSSMVLRADAVRALGGYCAERVSTDDTDLSIRLGKAGKFVQILSPITFGYRSHPANISSNMTTATRSMWYLIDNEKKGRYGGSAQRRERIFLITMFARPLSLGHLTQGDPREAWKVFRAIFTWCVRLGRARYLAAFPVIAARERIKKWIGVRPADAPRTHPT